MSYFSLRITTLHDKGLSWYLQQSIMLLIVHMSFLQPVKPTKRCSYLQQFAIQKLGNCSFCYFMTIHCIAGRHFYLPLTLIWIIREFGLYLHPTRIGDKRNFIYYYIKYYSLYGFLILFIYSYLPHFNNIKSFHGLLGI